MALKYLFFAEFADGHSFWQNPEDQSQTVTHGSSFTDVVEYEKKSPLVKFSLGHMEQDIAASVNLLDGHFELNGIPFDLHFNLPSEQPKFRIVYYRIQTKLLHTFADGSQKPNELETRYMLGWQTTIDGKNYQEVIIIN